MPKFIIMQKKLAYLPIALTLLFATFTATFALAKMETLTIAFAALTCLGAIGSILNTYYAQDDLVHNNASAQQDNDVAFNSRRHSEPISHAIDHKKVDIDEENDNKDHDNDDNQDDNIKNIDEEDDID